MKTGIHTSLGNNTPSKEISAPAMCTHIVNQNNPTGLLRFKRVLILYNPISGAGISNQIGQQIMTAFQSQGIQADMFTTRAIYQTNELENLLINYNLLLVIGGDGTAMKTVGAAAKTATPLYIVPAGNESLFAKLFNTTNNHEEIIAHLSRRSITANHFALVQETPFFLMLTMGLDAQVIANIGQRKGPSSNMMYVMAGLRAMLNYRTPEISLVVDGQKVLDRQFGYLIMANSNSYARNLNLVAEANTHENNLHVRFFPQSGLMPEIYKAIKMLFKAPANINNSQLFIGRSFELRVHNGPYPVQADGELLTFLDKNELNISMAQDSLLVLE